MQQHFSEADQCINELHAEDNKSGDSGERGHTSYWLIHLIFIYCYGGTFQYASVTDEFLVTK